MGTQLGAHGIPVRCCQLGALNSRLASWAASLRNGLRRRDDGRPVRVRRDWWLGRVILFLTTRCGFLYRAWQRGLALRNGAGGKSFHAWDVECKRPLRRENHCAGGAMYRPLQTAS